MVASHRLADAFPSMCLDRVANRRWTGLPAVVLASWLGCTDTLTVEDVREPFDPPATFQLWWQLTFECALIPQPDMDGVSWFATPECPGQPHVLGQWNARREITLLNAVRFNQDVVRHEMLHDFLDGDGNPTSPAWDKCGSPKGID